MRRLIAALLLLASTLGTRAEYTNIPRLPPSSISLPSGNIIVGNAFGVGAGVPMSGDCTLVAAGVITCTKTGGVLFGPLATLTVAKGALIYASNYGVVCDGTDEATRIDAAQTAAAALGVREIIFPNGSCGFSTTRQPTVPLMYVGQGKGGVAGVAGSPAAAVGTKFVWLGTTAVMFNFANLTQGWGIRDAWINHASAGNTSLVVDGSIGGTLRNVYMDGCGALSCITVTGTTNTAAWNLFESLTIEDVSDGTALIYLDGINLGGNSDHNLFLNTRLTLGGTRSGIVLRGNDNDTFINTYMYCTAGTGFGVSVVPVVLGGFNFPNENTFYHLESCAGAGRAWNQPVGTVAMPATIHGYSRGNGQDFPTLNGTPLAYEMTTGQKFNNAMITSCAGQPTGTIRSNAGVLTLCP